MWSMILVLMYFGENFHHVEVEVLQNLLNIKVVGENAMKHDRVNVELLQWGFIVHLSTLLLDSIK